MDKMAIRFFCKCTNEFRLADEEAGGLIQCPKCGLLNDVPLHQDLAAISEDGTYKLDAAPVLDDPETAAELIYVYTRGARDIHGDEKDMRASDEELREVHGEMIPLVPDEVSRVNAPRYDPETGELIHAFDVASRGGPGSADNASIPMAKATLSYAAGLPLRDRSLASGFIQLFSAPNMAVMFAIFCIHALLWPLQLVVMSGVFFLGFGIPPMLVAIASHYGNVIEDIGPFDKDDLPRPLRDVEWYGDIWLPFCNLFGSLLICYWPVMPLATILLMPDSPNPAALTMGIVILGGLGTFIFPAVILTLVGSGTALNLRPDRVLQTISKCGAAYFFITIVWIAAAGTYLWGFLGTTYAIGAAMGTGPSTHWFLHFGVTVPIMAGGIILMHYFCFCVGMLYRVHHEEFPWVLQRHVRKSLPVVAPPNRPTRKRQGQRVKPR